MLALGVGDLSANVIENRNRICDAIGASTKQFVAMKQGHTTNIYVIKNKHSFGGFSNINDSLKNIDAVITNLSNITLFTYSADCALSLFYDSNNHAIAVVHSGWRGALSNIYSNVLQRMVLEYGTKTKELFVGISPMISCEFYDVNESVISKFRHYYNDTTSQAFYKKKGKQYYLCLESILLYQLRTAGVQNIELSNMCTARDKSLFFSYHSEGQTGRFGLFAYLID